MPARPEAPSAARAAVTLQVGPDVPQLAATRLATALTGAGLLRPSAPPPLAGVGEPLALWLFVGIDPALGEQLMRLGALRPSRLFGVALTGEAAVGHEPADSAWVRLGLPRDRLVFWNGLESPELVLRRLAEVIEATVPPAATPGLVELVLRDGRVLRIPPDLPNPQLERLLCSFGG